MKGARTAVVLRAVVVVILGGGACGCGHRTASPDAGDAALEDAKTGASLDAASSVDVALGEGDAPDPATSDARDAEGSEVDTTPPPIPGCDQEGLTPLTPLGAASSVDDPPPCTSSETCLALAGTTTALGIWGASDSDVWAIFDTGVVLHWDGDTWSSTQGFYARGLSGISGTASDDVWVAGVLGTIAHFDGAHWCSVPDYHWRQAFLSVFARSRADVWAVGGTEGPPFLEGITVSAPIAVHWDGTSWSTTDLPLPQPTGLAFPGAIWDVWGYRSDDAWALGEVNTEQLDGSFITSAHLLHWNGFAWQDRDKGRSDRFPAVAIWGTTNIDVWIAGMPGLPARKGQLVPDAAGGHWDGTSWTASGAPVARRLWGLNSRAIWSFGPDGLSRWDGESWRVVGEPFDGHGEANFGGLWGSGADDVWVGAKGGPIQRWSGSSWRPAMPSP